MNESHSLQIGPRIEFSQGEILEDEEVAKILPFLALPDGAHLVRSFHFSLEEIFMKTSNLQSSEDYTYFHLVQPGPNPTTVFGISSVTIDLNYLSS